MVEEFEQASSDCEECFEKADKGAMERSKICPGCEEKVVNRYKAWDYIQPEDIKGITVFDKKSISLHIKKKGYLRYEISIENFIKQTKDFIEII